MTLGISIKCHYAECCYAECRIFLLLCWMSLRWVSLCWVTHFPIAMLNVSFSYCYAECHYAECCYASVTFSYCYAQCRYAGCRGAHWSYFHQSYLSLQWLVSSGYVANLNKTLSNIFFFSLQFEMAAERPFLSAFAVFFTILKLL